MRRLLTIVVAGIVGAAIAAALAPAGQEAVTPKQFAALTKRVKALETVMGSCLLHDAVPVTAYGGETNGYRYVQPDGTEQFVTALDITVQGDPVDAYLLAVHPDCAAAIGGGALNKKVIVLRR